MNSDTRWLESVDPIEAATAVARKLLTATGNLDFVARHDRSTVDERHLRLTVFLKTLEIAQKFVPPALESLCTSGPYVHARGSGATPHEAVLTIAEKLQHTIYFATDMVACLRAELADIRPAVADSAVLECWDAVSEAVRELPELDWEPIDAALVHAARVAMKASPSTGAANSKKPKWSKRSKTLTFRGEVVKTFTKTAGNQFLVFDAFEELEWPPTIDDPLSGGNADPATRVRETVSRLNNRLKGGLRFSTNGRGTGFSWSAK